MLRLAYGHRFLFVRSGRIFTGVWKVGFCLALRFPTGRTVYIDLDVPYLCRIHVSFQWYSFWPGVAWFCLRTCPITTVSREDHQCRLSVQRMLSTPFSPMNVVAYKPRMQQSLSKTFVSAPSWQLSHHPLYLNRQPSRGPKRRRPLEPQPVRLDQVVSA